MPSSYDAIKDLPLVVEGCAFEGLEFQVGEFERLTTVIKLRGAGEEGIGEDVVYDAVDHIGQQSHGPPDGLAHSGTFDEFSTVLDGIDLFPAGEPERAGLAPWPIARLPVNVLPRTVHETPMLLSAPPFAQELPRPSPPPKVLLTIHTGRFGPAPDATRSLKASPALSRSP